MSALESLVECFPYFSRSSEEYPLLQCFLYASSLVERSFASHLFLFLRLLDDESRTAILRFVDDHGRTLVILAIACDAEEALDVLLRFPDTGAGGIAKYLVAGEDVYKEASTVFVSARLGRYKALQALLARNVRDQPTQCGTTSLMAAIKSNNKACFAELFSRDPNSCMTFATKTGRSALMEACFVGMFGAARQIVHHAAAVGETQRLLQHVDKLEESVLHAVCKTKSVKDSQALALLVELITMGAPITRNVFGESPLTLAILRCKSEVRERLLSSELSSQFCIDIVETLSLFSRRPVRSANILAGHMDHIEHHLLQYSGHSAFRNTLRTNLWETWNGASHPAAKAVIAAEEKLGSFHSKTLELMQGLVKILHTKYVEKRRFTTICQLYVVAVHSVDEAFNNIQSGFLSRKSTAAGTLFKLIEDACVSGVLSCDIYDRELLDEINSLVEQTTVAVTRIISDEELSEAEYALRIDPCLSLSSHSSSHSHLAESLLTALLELLFRAQLKCSNTVKVQRIAEALKALTRACELRKMLILHCAIGVCSVRSALSNADKSLAEILRVMIDGGADVDREDSHRNRPLHVAVTSLRMLRSTVRVLIHARAELDTPNIDGVVPRTRMLQSCIVEKNELLCPLQCLSAQKLLTQRYQNDSVPHKLLDIYTKRSTCSDVPEKLLSFVASHEHR